MRLVKWELPEIGTDALPLTRKRRRGRNRKKQKKDAKEVETQNASDNFFRQKKSVNFVVLYSNPSRYMTDVIGNWAVVTEKKL